MSEGNRCVIEFVIDSQGVLLELSPAWEAITGFAPKSALGRPLLQFVADEDRRSFQVVLRSLLRDGGHPGGSAVRLLTATGDSLFVALCVAAPIEPGAGDGEGESDVLGALLVMGRCSAPSTAPATGRSG